jgi:hypothetical protein
MTDTEKELIKDYPEAAAFAGVAASVWNGNNSPLKIEMAVRGRLHTELEKFLGKDIKTVFLTDSDIRHIRKKHGSNETARGQIDITPEDFALIPLVLNEFDHAEHDITDKKGNKKLLFQKKCEGVVYVATVERGESKVEIRTFWKMREPGASC